MPSMNSTVRLLIAPQHAAIVSRTAKQLCSFSSACSTRLSVPEFTSPGCRTPQVPCKPCLAIYVGVRLPVSNDLFSSQFDRRAR